MKVVIVGAGWAGLLTAANLRARGVDDVVLLDRADHAGGVADSVIRDGYVLEPAAGSFLLPQPGLTPFVAGEVQPAAATTRHVWDGKALVTIPPGPKALLAPLVSPRAKLRAALEPLVPNSSTDESLDRLLQRRFGTDVGQMAAWLAASGVFAGDPALLSAAAAFPQLTGLVETHGSILTGMLRGKRSGSSLPAGPSATFGGDSRTQRGRGEPSRKTFVPATTMSNLAATVVRPLGDRFRPGVTVEAVRQGGNHWVVDGTERHTADHVVITTDPQVTGDLVDRELAAALAGPVAAPVVVVGLGGQWMDLPEGFGILTGPNARTSTRGVLLESSYAPHRAPEGAGLVKVIAGGTPYPGIVEEDDGSIIETVGSEVARILGHDLDVSFTEVIRHRPGIPQYVLGHGDWMRGIEAATPESLHLAGWGYRGVGISHLATDAARIADRIAAA